MLAWQSVLAGSARWSADQGDAIDWLRRMPDDAFPFAPSVPPPSPSATLPPRRHDAQTHSPCVRMTTRRSNQ